MLPESGSNQYACNFADLLVQVKLGRESRLKADYSYMVYSDSLRLMAGETTWNCWHQAWRAGRTFSMTMRSNTLWIPGKYFFLMATRDGECIIRFDLELDEKCCFTAGEPRRCEPLSDEDILAHQVFEAADFWNALCDFAGIAQLRRKTLEWLKLNAANSNGDNVQQTGRDVPDRNLLVTKDWGIDNDWYPFDVFHHVAYHCVAKMLIMSVPGLKIRIADCSEFYKPDQENPSHLLDAFFDKENPLYDDTFNMEDHVNYWLWKSPYKNNDRHNQPSTFVFVLYNILALDEEALNRLHEVLQEERQYIILCDYQETIDNVIERKPSLRAYFPEANRIALENATLEEVIRRTISNSELYEFHLTPAAVDKVCRLLVKEQKQKSLGDSGYYARQLAQLPGLYKRNSDDKTVIDADDIDEAELLS